MKDNRAFILREDKVKEFLSKSKIKPRAMIKEVSSIEKRKSCINYEDGCEEWAGCPCVYYKAEMESGE